MFLMTRVLLVGGASGVWGRGGGAVRGSQSRVGEGGGGEGIVGEVVWISTCGTEVMLRGDAEVGASSAVVDGRGPEGGREEGGRMIGVDGMEGVPATGGPSDCLTPRASRRVRFLKTRLPF